MKFTNFIFVLAITLTFIFTLAIGSSYAYYASSEGISINASSKPLNFDPGTAINFIDGEYINAEYMVPIKEADVDKLAYKKVFQIIPNKEILKSSTVVNIYMDEITMDDALKINDFKYKLTCNNQVVGSGTGSNIGGSLTTENKKILIGKLSTYDKTLNIDTNNDCFLNIWINETLQDQNNLMSKSFSAKIISETIFKN